MAVHDFVYSKFEEPILLELVEDPEVSFQVTSYRAEFAVNSVPLAVVNIAAGKDARAPLRDITREGEKLKILRIGKTIPVRITARLRGSETLDSKWPNKRIVLFEGDLTSVQPSRVYDQAVLTGIVRHWLGRLHNSSMFASSGFLGNPFAMNMSLLLEKGHETEAAPNLSLIAAAKNVVGWKHLNPDSDFWEFLKNVYLKLSQFVPTFSSSASRCQMNNKPSPDLEKAIHGIRTPGKLSFRDSFRGDSSLLQSISDFLSIILFESGDASVWSSLISKICPSFGLVLCPAIEEAVLMPDLPQIKVDNKRVKPWRTVGDEILGFSLSFREAPAIRAVSVYSVHNMETTIETGEEGRITVPGCYSSEKVKDGLIMFASAPPWLMGMVFTNSMAKMDAGGGQPSKTSTNQANQQPKRPVATSVVQSIIDEYARLVFTRAKTKSNSLEIAFPLRMDIAPGSIIKIVPTSKDIRIGSSMFNLTGLYGNVSSVRVNIDMEKMNATTVILVDTVRTQEDNDDSDVSMEEHPLFSVDSMKQSDNSIGSWLRKP